MVSGRLDKIIILERLKTEVNKFGEDETKAFVPYCRTRAEVLFGGNNKMEIGNEVTFIDDVVFHVRLYHIKQIQEFDRIVYFGRTYTILTIQPDVDNQMLILKCRQYNE